MDVVLVVVVVVVGACADEAAAAGLPDEDEVERRRAFAVVFIGDERAEGELLPSPEAGPLPAEGIVRMSSCSDVSAEGDDDDDDPAAAAAAELNRELYDGCEGVSAPLREPGLDVDEDV